MLKGLSGGHLRATCCARRSAANSSRAGVLFSPFFLLRRMLSTNATQHDAITYEVAVRMLNSLQSNAQVLAKARDQRRQTMQTNVAETAKFLSYLDITPEQIDDLNCIHIAGTKGKGSTCAFVESLLRHAGFKTGFYSSPHLVHVRERIRIDGQPLDEQTFAENFLQVYNRIEDRKAPAEDMPAYFKFLTLLAFRVFLRERVDVAIVEVGIGGEHDCTNVLRNPTVCGITSLDYEHTRLLGDTLEEIAWQKAGITKPGSLCVTVQQPPAAKSVIEERSRQRQCSLVVAPEFDVYSWGVEKTQLRFGIPGRHQLINISLALQLAGHWLIRRGKLAQPNTNQLRLPQELISSLVDKPYEVPAPFLEGLEKCQWPGRCQLLERGRLKFFLDGAHTLQSIKYCAEWFAESSSTLKTIKAKDGGSKPLRILIFHCTGDRSSSILLPPFKDCDFDYALFCPTRLRVRREMKEDSTNLNQDSEEEMKKCGEDLDVWKQLSDGKVCAGNKAVKLASIEDALRHINLIGENNPDMDLHILVTGSLYLVGGILHFEQDHAIGQKNGIEQSIIS